ncbi:site-specific recombinase [Herbaspirillum chlorophenolicum]|uniref:Site-specific recombinase n=1 Tax=Herbaspirillum chlorophenolicum TaxID=211589 RepID=A0ABW8EW85_9BURK
MKFLFFKMLVVWRRLRHGMQARYMARHDVGRQLDSLMRRVDPASAWHERANWLIDVAEWLRHRPAVSLLDRQAWNKVRSQRLAIMLDWLDQHRDVRRNVQNAMQKTLREANGPELFSTTGLPHEPGFFGELVERLARMILPRHLSPTDLSSLFTALFPDPDDANWLLELDNELLVRLWKLFADDGISHMYWQQIEEAITYLTTTVIADGISPAFRQRLEPKMPMRATPFLALRREIEAWLRTNPYDQAALRSVRMLVAVCHAQTDRIYAHLDEYGVSVSLVYRIERMRAHLQRIGRLIDVRAAVPGEPGAGRVQLLLADLISAHHNRGSVRGLMRRSFALLARKMVERNANHGEQAIARDAAGYRKVLKGGLLGGAVLAGTALLQIGVARLGSAHFFEGALASLNYAASFLLIAAVGGVLATRQPAVAAPMLASHMGELDADGMRGLIAEAGLLLRSQSAAIFGNLLAVAPVVALVCTAGWFLFGVVPMRTEQAHAELVSLSLVGPTPLYAALTGVLLWLSSLAAGFADNWFALRRVREIMSNQRRLVHAFGPLRAERCAAWLERNVATISGSVVLGLLLGMTPVLAEFFGLPLDVRQVTLAAGTLAAAAFSLGWQSLATPEFWLAAGGVAISAFLGVGVAFACALTLALRARDVPRRMRRFVQRAVLRRFVTAPAFFIFPERAGAGVDAAVHDEEDSGEDEDGGNGGDGGSATPVDIGNDTQTQAEWPGESARDSERNVHPEGLRRHG